MAAIESGVVTKRLPLRLQELEEEEEKLKAELDFAKASDFIITPEQIEFLLWQFVDPLDDESWEDYKRRIIKCFVQSVFLDETMSEEELDYSFLFSQAPKFSMDGRCMYCNHCLPCPQHINIAQVQKYLDILCCFQYRIGDFGVGLVDQQADFRAAANSRMAPLPKKKWPKAGGCGILSLTNEGRAKQ